MNRKTLTRAITFTTGVALGLNLLTGAAFAAPSTDVPDSAASGVVTTDTKPRPQVENPSEAKYECSDSHHSDTGHGANNSDGYQSTCDEDDFGGNGQEDGPGNQTGKPCAGCVGNADDKNPPGQYPDGSDHNSGYECDGRDRRSENQQGNGNHGIGDENPAHTGCESTPVVEEPPTDPEWCPNGDVMPADRVCPTVPVPVNCPGENTQPPMVDHNKDGKVDLDDCHVPTPPPYVCPDTDMTPEDVNEDGHINGADCVKETPETPEIPETPATPTCPDGSAMPSTDQDGNGNINAADCKRDEVIPEVIEETPVVVITENPAPVAEVVTTNVVEIPVEVPTQVFSLELGRATVLEAAPVAPLETRVLGVAIERGAAPLARTGASDVAVQALAALALLAVGFGLLRVGRRPAID